MRAARSEGKRCNGYRVRARNLRGRWSTTYCLAQTPAVGSEVLVYAPNGGTFTVDLSHSAGRTSGSQTFSTPSTIVGDSVLYVVAAAGHA